MLSEEVSGFRRARLLTIQEEVRETVREIFELLEFGPALLKSIGEIYETYRDASASQMETGRMLAERVLGEVVHDSNVATRLKTLPRVEVIMGRVECEGGRAALEAGLERMRIMLREVFPDGAELDESAWHRWTRTELQDAIGAVSAAYVLCSMFARPCTGHDGLEEPFAKLCDDVRSLAKRLVNADYDDQVYDFQLKHLALQSEILETFQRRNEEMERHTKVGQRFTTVAAFATIISTIVVLVQFAGLNYSALVGLVASLIGL